jgi:G3E family GTPase
VPDDDFVDVRLRELLGLDLEDDLEHDPDIVSVSLTTRQPLDAQKFSAWIKQFIMTHGVDVLRTKGILHLLGQERRYVFQGVHLVMDSAWSGRWDDAPRESRLVFIGRQLDGAELERDFLACAAVQ